MTRHHIQYMNTNKYNRQWIKLSVVTVNHIPTMTTLTLGRLSYFKL